MKDTPQMATITRLPAPIEVYMYLHDRHYLRYLMADQGKTTRQVAAAAGWSSHSFLVRLLQGKVSTLAVEPAEAISIYLGVHRDRLFTPRSSQKTAQAVAERKIA